MIQAFGSVDSLRAATTEEIVRKCSLSTTLAEKVLETLNKEGPDDRENP